MPTDEPNNMVGNVKITQGYFPTPIEALDLGWTPEKILADCRRVPKEDLTEKLQERLLVAGLTPLQIKTLFPYSRRQIKTMRDVAQSFKNFGEGEGGHMQPEKLPGEPVKLTFVEGLKQGLSPRTALEVCEPARAKDIRKELLEQCVEGGLSRDEIAKGFGTTLKMLNNTATKVRFKWPRQPRPERPDNAGQGGEQTAAPVAAAGGVFEAPAMAIVGEPAEKEAVSPIGDNIQTLPCGCIGHCVGHTLQSPPPEETAIVSVFPSGEAAAVASENRIAAAHIPTAEELAELFSGDHVPPRTSEEEAVHLMTEAIKKAGHGVQAGPKPMIVYFAGAVDVEPLKGTIGWCNKILAGLGLDDYPSGSIRAWRKRAAEILEAEGIQVIDSTRHLAALADLKISNEILVDSNLIDIQLADVMLVEMDRPGHAYFGTAIDVRKAYERGIPIIVWGTANRASRYLHHHATVIVDDLDSALAIVKGLAIGMRWKARKGTAV